ncbi:hypothetical protein RvY_02852 [Ramazzottius varieornatus]|uniref:Moesin/ezrin/radixin homolog 1 n=1 Tax=Ramazzottius varieornatus TaxID=947166 RepID=A0A1D1UT60_RAMVA|nr:hypothetical protein RvY_02852 [Ramazzottius varieornatus]
MVVSAVSPPSQNRGGGNASGTMSLSRQASSSQPSTAAHNSSKTVNCRVEFLDNQHTIFRVPPKALGQTLFDEVCGHLGLLESDYFGLEYHDGSAAGNKYWLDLEKPVGRQLAVRIPSSNVLNFYFGVKFYTPDPVQLEEELTRYLYVLQIRKDLASGLMPCQDSTAALLAAYVVQAEEGDYSPDNYRDYTYLLKYKFLPQQDVTFLSQVRDSHVQLVGQSPAEADMNFLETARRCEMYGIKLHAANDHEGVALNLAVAHMGIVVFQNLAKINIFSWAKIRKLSFKRKRFLIKLHPEGYGFYKETAEFYFDSRNSCKNFWKKCIEHHGFFRCPIVQTLPRSKTKIFPAGSSFRFSGRTQKQVLEFARDNYGKRPSFHRSGTTSRIRSSQSCGASLAATPLLPMARARDSRYNTTGGTRSRRSIQGDNGALARSKSEPMEVTEVTNQDRSSDSGSRTLERGHRTDMDYQGTMAVYSDEHMPREHHQTMHHTTITQIDRYDEVRPNGHHIHEVAVTVEDLVKDIPIGRSNLHSPARSTLDRSATSSQRLGQNGSHTLPLHASKGLTSVSELEDLSRKINGWKQQSQESFLKSFESKSFGESLRTLADDSMDGPTGLKRRNPMDFGYFVAKEILNAERAYKNDLEVICVHLKRALDGAEDVPSGTLHGIFSLLQPIYENQGTLLVEIEHRLSTWDTRSVNMHKADGGHIGDLLLKQNDALDQYLVFLDKLPELLVGLEVTYRKNRQFEHLYRTFELEKYCFLPVAAFLLRPAQRLLQYQSVLERLLTHYPPHHFDYGDCEAALQNFRRASGVVHEAVRHAEHFTKLMELQRDLLGIENLAVPAREFIREGCLQKFSKKGYQQRMFILLTDVLLYCNRVATSSGHFKVHGQVGVRGMMIEDSTGPKHGMDFCFTIYGGNRALIVAASSAEEKSKWLHDLQTAMDQSKRLAYDKLLQYSTLKSISSSDEVLHKHDAFNSSAQPTGTVGDGDTLRTKSPSEKSQMTTRSNTTLHVCWHRNTTISCRELSKSFQYQLCGFLLRKFKSSDGWQKLWVVFSNFCLFFFKNYQESAPLASLPLIGYRVAIPSFEDNILKDHVFKLHFKSHTYFFRSENEYTFNRWMDVLIAVTSSDQNDDSEHLTGNGMHV